MQLLQQQGYKDTRGTMNIPRTKLERHLEIVRATYKDKNWYQNVYSFIEKSIQVQFLHHASDGVIAAVCNEKCSVSEDGFGMHDEQPMLCSYPANEANLSCLCLFQNKMFLNFSTERELGSHQYMVPRGALSS